MGTFIPFGEWLPDLPIFENPGATVAKNVIADAQGYRSFPNDTAYSTSLGSRCQGAMVARDVDGNYYNYAGDASALYVSTTTTWSSVTRTVGGGYATATTDYWEFTQFGNQLIAVNGRNNDTPQVISVGAANFADLSGAPPRAAHVASVRDFVVMGNISATASFPQMVRWCAINNVASWTPSAATLADFQDLPGDGGHIQKVIGGEYGIILQERAIWRMTFVGSPLVFQFDKVQTNIGAFAPQSAISYRNITFFLSEDGFYMFDGSNVTPIGQNKVDRTFFADLDTNYVHRIHAVIDPVRKLVAWAYPAAGNSGGDPNRVLLYHWGSQKWSRLEDLNIQFLFRSVSGVITLESMDTNNPNLDAITISLDDSSWNGGIQRLSMFNGNNRQRNFNGSAMPATVDTPEVHLNRAPDGLTHITQVRPVAEGLSASVTVAVGARNTLTQSVSYTTAVSPISTGFAQVRSSARFHRFRINTSDDVNFDFLQGVDITGTPEGQR